MCSVISVAFKLQTLSKNYIGSVIIVSKQDCPALIFLQAINEEILLEM